MTVSQKAKAVKQPWGGYIRPSAFKETRLDDGRTLCDAENISPQTVGMAVDYLSRMMLGFSPEEAFRVSLLGANCAVLHGLFTASEEAERYLAKIKGLDDASIINACHLVSFDVWYRNPAAAIAPLRCNREEEDIFLIPLSWASEDEPNADTISNIRIMVERSLVFFKSYGPVVKDSFTFEGAYTDEVSAGEGDFLTADTMWDFKVSKKKPISRYTLQLLMYYILGLRSGKSEYQTVRNLGIFNPRLNALYQMNVDAIPAATIRAVERDVIGYHD